MLPLPAIIVAFDVLFAFITAMKNSSLCLSWVFLSLVFLGTFFLNGCDSTQPKNKEQGEPPAPPVEEPPQLAAVPPQPPVPEPAQAKDNTTTVAAAPGMSGKGNYGTPTANNPMEIITVPISTMFRTKDQLVLQQIKHAMNLYEAGHGRLPATHEEFVIDIIQENNIILPQLPAGQKYEYDPKDGELKIRKPKGSP